jgi:hypothetical protein
MAESAKFRHAGFVREAVQARVGLIARVGCGLNIRHGRTVQSH